MGRQAEASRADRGPLEGPGPGWVGRATWGFVGFGLALRAFAYFLDFPLWWDEAFVAVNLLRRDYRGLLQPLDYGQVGPILFLWAELASTRLLGFSEWSLRLVPWLAAMASVVVFRSVATRLLGGRSALVAVAVFAVAVHPIRHAADLKPYSLDLLVALILQGLALRWWREPDQPGRLLALAGFAPIALGLSHPAIFVAASVGPGHRGPRMEDPPLEGPMGRFGVCPSRRAWLTLSFTPCSPVRKLRRRRTQCE